MRLGPGAGDPFGRSPLVHRVDVSVQITDRDRFRACLTQGFDCGAEARLVERLYDCAVLVEPLQNFLAERAGHERRRSRGVEIEQTRACLTADLENVAEPTG